MAGRSGRTVRDLRRANRTAVLQRLCFGGPLSRFEPGPATGLSSGSVSNVVADLVADGLVEEAGSVDSDGGRPRTLLRVAPAGGHMIGGRRPDPAPGSALPAWRTALQERAPR